MVSRHEGAEDLREGIGKFRWCVYCYIYKGHKFFGKELPELPFHGGITYTKKHVDAMGNCTSYQLGADYSHIWDNHFTHMELKEEAEEVFQDAELLYNRLEELDKDE